MHFDQLSAHLDQVEAYLTTRMVPSDSALETALAFLLRYPERRALIATVADTLRIAPPVAAVLISMVLFAPPDQCSFSLFQQLQAQIARDRCGHLPERCLEVVLAWGCGRRSTDGAEAPIWPRALIGLAHTGEPAVATVLRQLDDLQLPQPARKQIAALRSDPRRGAGSYAASLALELSAGGGLDAWQPAQAGLDRYLVVRFGGQPGHHPLRSGAFSTGMLYTLLYAEIGLLNATVAFSVCASPECNGAQIEQSIRQSQPLQLVSVDERGLFEGNHCVKCGRADDPQRTYRTPRRHWLIVPKTYGGAYEQRLFFNCTACGHHFPCSASYIDLHSALEQFRDVTDPEMASPEQRTILAQARAALRQARRGVACPLCSRYAVSQRPVHLWMYAPER